MATQAILRPASEADLCDAIADAVRAGERLALVGGGSKADFGHPTVNGRELRMDGFAGIVDYDPAELVLTAGAGTPLAEIEALVAAHDQMLAFAPFDHGPIYGRSSGASTIGGVVAAGGAGSARVSQGSARDHLLGFRAVSGRGEAFVAGAKVVKNVTGYDLSKLVCGSWGRLVALCEVTLKVLPRPRTVLTAVLEGLDAVQAVRAMSAALGSQASVSAAAHLPGTPALTLFRLEGFGPSVIARRAMLAAVLAAFGPLHDLGEDEAGAAWDDIRIARSLFGNGPLWRINLPARQAPDLVAGLEKLDARWLMDWGGGLVWASGDCAPGAVRAAAKTAGGHAVLVRGDKTVRAATPALHPPDPGVAALEERVRRAFDPAGVFETGRF